MEKGGELYYAIEQNYEDSYKKIVTDHENIIDLMKIKKAFYVLDSLLSKAEKAGVIEFKSQILKELCEFTGGGKRGVGNF